MNAQASVSHPFPEVLEHEVAPYWGASLRLRIARAQERSILADVRHDGPLRIQRPFYPEGTDLCHLYLLHPPGGLVSGDQLTINVEVDKGAKALVTTPSAGKVYRANRRRTAQIQKTRLVLDEDTSLEWLPQESILFDQASAVLETEIHLAREARLFAWELVCLGRPHSGEDFRAGSLGQRFSVWSQGVPLYLDQFSLDGGDRILDAHYGLQGFCCLGTMVIGCGTMPTASINTLVDQLRERLPYDDGLKVGVTRLRSLIVLRLLGGDTERAKQALTDAWSLARPEVLGRRAELPRIWNT